MICKRPLYPPIAINELYGVKMQEIIFGGGFKIILHQYDFHDFVKRNYSKILSETKLIPRPIKFCQTRWRHYNDILKVSQKKKTTKHRLNRTLQQCNLLNITQTSLKRVSVLCRQGITLLDDKQSL